MSSKPKNDPSFSRAEGPSHAFPRLVPEGPGNRWHVFPRLGLSHSFPHIVFAVVIVVVVVVVLRSLRLSVVKQFSCKQILP